MKTKEVSGLLSRIAQRLGTLPEPLKQGILLGGRLVLGFLLGRTELFGCCAPLGAGFAAAGGSDAAGTAGTIGVMLGAVSGFGLKGALRYAAIALTCYAASYLLRSAAFSRSRWFPPLTAACMTAVIGGVYLYYGPRELPQTAAYVTELLLAGGCAMLYGAALRGERGDKRTAGLLALGMSLCMALEGLKPGGLFSVGRCLAFLAVLTAARLGGPSSGGLVGLLLGLSLDAAAGTRGVCAMALGCAGALGGLSAAQGRLWLALSAVLGNGAVVFWAAEGSLRTGLIGELFLAAVVLTLLPERFFENIRPLRQQAESQGYLRYLQGRTGLAAAAFGELTAMLQATPEQQRNREDVLSVFDVAAEQVCRSCGRRELCWGRDYESTRNAMQNAIPGMLQRGGARPEDLPEWFRTNCENIRGYSAAVSLEVKALLRSRQQRSRLRTDRELLCRQYADFAAILRDLSGTEQGRAGEELRLARRLRKHLSARAPGLSVNAFRDRNGRLHLELEGGGLGRLTAGADWLSPLEATAGTALCCLDPGARPLHLLEREPLEAEVSVASACRGGRAPSGDVARSFKTAEGLLYLVVADGMGSGPEAAADSRMAAALAEKLLRAGAAPQTAMRILNTALLLRSEKQLSTLSIDLMQVNLFTGEAVILKYGAAPSYVREGGMVQVLRGVSPAAGTENAAPDTVQLRLSPGASAVILSDGAAHAESVARRLEEAGDLQELARSILTEAAASGGWEDDMTVLTLRLQKSGEGRISGAPGGTLSAETA